MTGVDLLMIIVSKSSKYGCDYQWFGSSDTLTVQERNVRYLGEVESSCNCNVLVTLC